MIRIIINHDKISWFIIWLFLLIPNPYSQRHLGAKAFVSLEKKWPQGQNTKPTYVYKKLTICTPPGQQHGYYEGVRRCAVALFSSEFRLAHHPSEENVRLAALLLFFEGRTFFRRRRKTMCGQFIAADESFLGAFCVEGEIWFSPVSPQAIKKTNKHYVHMFIITLCVFFVFSTNLTPVH